MTKSEFQSRFDEHFHDDLKRCLAGIVVGTYGETDRNATDLGIDPPFRTHAVPQARHYLIQSRIMQQVRDYDGVTAHIAYFDSGGTEPYAVLSSGNFHLTVSMIRKRGVLPRSTPYRLSNSQINSLLSDILIDDGEDEDCFAIFTHVPSRDNKHPTYLELVVPNCNYTGAEFVYDWSPLVEFTDGGIVVPNEEVSLPELKMKAAPKKSKEG